MTAQHFIKSDRQILGFQFNFLDRAVGAVVRHLSPKQLNDDDLQAPSEVFVSWVISTASNSALDLFYFSFSLSGK